MTSCKPRTYELRAHESSSIDKDMRRPSYPTAAFAPALAKDFPVGTRTSLFSATEVGLEGN